MVVNKRDCSKLRYAIQIAVESHRDLIDAHTTQYAMNDHRDKFGLVKQVVPKEHRPFVAKLKRDIHGWAILYRKLKES